MKTEDGVTETGKRETNTTTDCGRDFRRAVGQAGTSLTKLVAWIEDRRIELTPDLMTRIEGLGVIIGRYGRASGTALAGKGAAASHGEVPQ